MTEIPQRLQWKKVEGFTLIEVMVALALLVIVGATLMELFSQNLSSSRKTRDYTTAILLAGSEMEKATTLIEPGTESGTFDKYTITREIKMIEELSEKMKIYEILVMVSWDSNKYELKTVRLQVEKENEE